MDMKSNLVVLKTESGLLRAHVLKAHLESRGIPVLLDYESAGPAIGITVDGLGEVRVMVPARLERQARRILLHEGRRAPRPLKASRRPPLRRGRTRGSQPPATVGRRR